MGRGEDANAALLAASRGGEPRAAEMARELLPDRYPFVPEFRRALGIGPGQYRSCGASWHILCCAWNSSRTRRRNFAVVTETAPGDLLSATQLGFLLYARGERAAAQPLFDRVLAGSDDDLANRVRAVLRMPQVLRPRPEPQQASIDAKVMAERSIKAGYMKDALKYLEVAHEADPGDFDVMLKLGWTLQHSAPGPAGGGWFDLARRSPDPQVAAEAARAWKNLRLSTERWRTSGWLYPIYSTRWNTFSPMGR